MVVYVSDQWRLQRTSCERYDTGLVHFSKKGEDGYKVKSLMCYVSENVRVFLTHSSILIMCQPNESVYRRVLI